MAKDCNFGDFLDRALRDRFICGISNENIQQKLFNDSTLKAFDKVAEIALMMETTKQDIEIIHGGTMNFMARKSYNEHTFSKQRSNSGQHTQHAQLNQHTQQQQQQQYHNNGSYEQHQQQQQPREQRACYTCGSTSHIARFCTRTKVVLKEDIGSTIDQMIKAYCII